MNPDPTAWHVDSILSLLKASGNDFTGYSQGSITRRLLLFMKSKKINSLSELRERICVEPGLSSQVSRALTVNYTELFRDPGFFKTLREKTFPYLSTYPSVKIWIAGCSTGEEIYSLAILLHETDLLRKAKIYATDCNEEVLEIASSGIMSPYIVREASARYIQSGGKFSLAKYYAFQNNKILFHDFLRSDIQFVKHNLISEPVLNEFHLVLCRNVLIYFNPDLQNHVLNLLQKSLNNLGYLGTGNKENIRLSQAGKSFRAIDSKNKIYRKILLEQL